MYSKHHITMLSILVTILALLNTASAWWIVGCGSPVVTERLDPIMQPGHSPSLHVHAVMGGDAFAADMPSAQNTTRDSTCTSCVVTKDLSNYWVPNLYFRDPQNGSFTSVDSAGGMTIYYLQRIDSQDPLYHTGIHAFPPGFRMVAGDPFQRSLFSPPTLAQRAISFACLASTPSPQTNGLPDRKCSNGLRVQVSFPSCWDGRRLDSPDHRSHVAYPSLMDNGVCPESHPKRLMYVFYEVVYAVDKLDGLWTEGHGEQPFVFSNGDPTGYGYHGDFLNGWDTELLQEAIEKCGDETGGDVHKCSVLEPHTQSADEQNRCKKKPELDEQVFGTLDKLPGCNLPQKGPERAKQPTC